MKPAFSQTRLALAIAYVLLPCVPSSAWSHGLHLEGQLSDVTVVEGLEPNFSDGTLTSSQGVIDRRRLSNQNPDRASDVLETVPGLAVTQHSGGGKANQYFLRGFSLDHGTDFSIRYLGVPLNLPAHAHGQGYTDSNMLIPELLDRIEYRKGPYFAQDGDFSSAGALTIDTITRLRRPLLTVGLGQWGYQRMLLANSTPLNNESGELLYAAEYQRQDGPWQVPENLGKTNALLSYLHKIDARSSLQVHLSAYENRWTATDHIPEAAVRQGLIGRFGSLDPTAGGNTRRVALSTQYGIVRDNSSSSLSAYLVDYSLNLFSDFTYSLRDNTPFGRPGVFSDQFNQQDKRVYYGASGNHTLLNNLSFVNSRLSVGFDVRTDDVKPTALYDSIARERVFTRSEDQLKQTSMGVFVAQQVSPLQWLRITPALRADHYQVNLQGNYDDDEDNTTPNVARSGRRSASLVSPKLSVALGPFQGGHEFFVAHGQGFHSNDPRGLFTANPVNYLVRTKGSELVWANAQLMEGLKLSSTYFRLKSDSELVFVGDAGVTEPKSPSQRDGLELLAEYRNRSGLSVNTHMNWVNARFINTDQKEIPNAIRRSAGLELNQALGVYSAGYRFRYLGSSPLVEDGSIRSNSLVQSDVYLSRNFGKDFNVTLSVFNLMDRKNSDIEYGQEFGLNGQSAVGRTFHPALPRHVRVNFTMLF